MIRELLRKVLFRCFGLKIGAFTDSEKIQSWLGNSYPDPGFQDYVFRRNMKILQDMGEGMEQKEYWIAMGKREELGYMLAESKRSWGLLEAKDRIRRAKLDAEKAARNEKK